MLTGWRKTVSKFFIIPQRVILAIMGFLAIANAYTMRVCLSVAITQMAKKPNYTQVNDGSAVCEADPNDVHSNSSNDDAYDWDPEMQGIILSAFFWGYVITHLPGGVLAERFGGKYTLGLGILSTALFTLATPVAVVYGGPWALVVLRMLMGLGEGTTFPALSALLASWIPLNERSKLGSFVFGGGQVGTIAGTLISGYLIHTYDTWHSVFYFFGVVAIIWFIIFTLICYSNPEAHPFISDDEKEFLRAELGQLERNKDLPPTPWRAIIVSAPMLALIAAQVGHDWGFFIMVTDLPKYMSDVLRFSIKDNGIYSAVPYIFMWVVSILTGFLSDWLIVKRYLNITNARKVFTGVAAILPAIFIVAASYAGCDKMLVVILFTVAMGFMGTFYPGMKVNPLDLSPNYAGSIMALTNGVGAITGIVAPYLVGVMTPTSSLNEWRLVFWIAFIIFLITTVIYSLWASGEVQPWNEPAKHGALETGQTKSNLASGQILSSAQSDLQSKTEKQ